MKTTMQTSTAGAIYAVGKEFGEDIEYISKSTQIPERQIELWLQEKAEESEEK